MPVRLATLDDLDEIQDLSAFWDEQNAEPVRAEILADYIENDRVFCVQEEEDILGVTIVSQNADKSVHIARFFVHPDYQGEGLGSEMMTEVTALLDEECTPAFASVAGTNPAMSLYERFGFEETDSFNPPTDEHIALMRAPEP